ncbi:MAG TPA: DNA ligase D [Gammaproteobacteria bacterium]
MQEPSARDIDKRLKEYRRKRDFTRTLEPSGADAAVEEGCLYVMHQHAASHDHFDLRLEQNGVLRSWALPKGASLEPGEKRLAVEVEDHPLEYGGFEGVIPQEEYGGGTVMLWDAGRWRLNGKNKEGHLDFILEGQKLKGAWTLVRTRMKGRGKEGKNWLLIKRSDPGKGKLEPDDRSVASGRSMDEIARDRDNAWIKGEIVERIRPPAASDIAGARKAPFPKTFRPQLAGTSDAPPGGDGWIHEIKFDGYRVIASLRDGKVKLTTRNGHDWTHRFATLAETLEALPVKNAVLDGEIVAMLPGGFTSFRHLQEAISNGRTANLAYQVFDLVHLDGHDLSGATLLDRKQALAQLLESAAFPDKRTVRYSDHLQGQGAAFFEQACRLGLEGILSKRANSHYRAGRGKQWRKVKCTQHEEFVVGGFTEPGGSREGFGSLLLGAYANGEFAYAGRTGTGFSNRQIEQLHEMLAARETDARPFRDDVPDSRGAHWVKPEIVVEVEFTERTRDGRLRHPVFRGLREDRDAREIVLNEAVDMQEQASTRETETAPRRRKAGATVAGVRITHPERVMYPELGVTKLDLARYYEEIQDYILPLLAERPLSLLRCPEGWREECFFQKHPRQAMAKGLPRISVQEKKGLKEYVYVRTIADIVALVQAGTLEFHPWGSKVSDVERPDMMIFDLDPSEGVAWSRVLHTATGLRDRLDALGLASFPRTTGGKGFHLVVPLKPEADWNEVKDFAKAVSERHAQDDPKRLTTNLSKTKRRGRIFIDYLRNGRGQTAIASYSLRAREGATAAVPLRWDEVGEALRSDRYNIGNLRRRLGALNEDPWEGFAAAGRSITAKMRRAVGLEGGE